MKIRSGFVSNSSSSSFIVAFEKVPRTVPSLIKMLFGPDAKPYDVKAKYDHGATLERIAETVLGDLSDKDSKCKKEGLIRMLSSVYEVPWRKDDIENNYRERRTWKWHGTDAKAYQALIDLNVEVALKEDEQEQRMREIVRSKIGECPMFGEERVEWMKKNRELRRNDPRCKKIEEETRKDWHEKWDKDEELRKKVAEKDLEAFERDNESCKIRVFHYADKDGSFGSLMEHGGIFDRLPHIRISHH